MIELENSKRLNIRVDSSGRIGSGHFQRCLAIAEEARNLGVSVRFLYSQLDDLSIQALDDSGIESAHVKTPAGLEYEIPSVEAEWAQADQENDAKEVLNALSLEKSEHILLDHYGLGDHWVRIVVGRVGPRNVVVVKDDINRIFSAESVHLGFASPDDLAKSIVLDRGNQLPNYLSSYFPISQAVKEVSQSNGLGSRTALTAPIRRVLVYLGNSDVRGHIERILLAMKELTSGQDFEISVLSNLHAPEFDSLALTTRKHSRVTWVSFDNQKEYLNFLMEQDLVIGAGGVASLERLYLGVPQIVFAVADNQIPNAVALSKWGVLKWAGDLRQQSVEEIETQIRPVFDDPEPLRRRALLGRLFIDGFGARRLVQTAVAPGIYDLSIRVVRDTDSSTLFSWANDPESRRSSLENHTISPEEHIAWFLRVMESDNKTNSAYTVEHEGCPVGYVIFQLQKDNTYNISYALDRPFRGLGLSAQLVSMGLQAHNTRKHRATYRASVNKTNLASIKTLESLNFKRVSTSGEFIELLLAPNLEVRTSES